MRTEEEIRELQRDLIPFEVGEKSTYMPAAWTEAVSHTLRWVLGEEPETPLPEEN
jgi:hypothetical protein